MLPVFKHTYLWDMFWSSIMARGRMPLRSWQPNIKDACHAFFSSVSCFYFQNIKISHKFRSPTIHYEIGEMDRLLIQCIQYCELVIIFFKLFLKSSVMENLRKYNDVSLPSPAIDFTTLLTPIHHMFTNIDHKKL